MKQIRRLPAVLIFFFSLACVAPVFAQKATVTVTNTDCKSLNGPNVNVHIYDSDLQQREHCTNEWVRVPIGSKGQVQTIQGYYYGTFLTWKTCKYNHEAAGTASIGERDITGYATVTCKKGVGGVCHCKKN